MILTKVPPSFQGNFYISQHYPYLFLSQTLKQINYLDWRKFGNIEGEIALVKHLKSLNEAKYNFKDDAMTAYMKGKISAQELDKIAKNDFNSSVATSNLGTAP